LGKGNRLNVDNGGASAYDYNTAQREISRHVVFMLTVASAQALKNERKIFMIPHIIIEHLLVLLLSLL
jgi:hypothetical protein